VAPVSSSVLGSAGRDGGPSYGGVDGSGARGSVSGPAGSASARTRRPPTAIRRTGRGERDAGTRSVPGPASQRAPGLAGSASVRPGRPRRQSSVRARTMSSGSRTPARSQGSAAARWPSTRAARSARVGEPNTASRPSRTPNSSRSRSSSRARAASRRRVEEAVLGASRSASTPSNRARSRRLAVRWHRGADRARMAGSASGVRRASAPGRLAARGQRKPVQRYATPPAPAARAATPQRGPQLLGFRALLGRGRCRRQPQPASPRP